MDKMPKASIISSVIAFLLFAIPLVFAQNYTGYNTTNQSCLNCQSGLPDTRACDQLGNYTCWDNGIWKCEQPNPLLPPLYSFWGSSGYFCGTQCPPLLGQGTSQNSGVFKTGIDNECYKCGSGGSWLFWSSSPCGLPTRGEKYTDEASCSYDLNNWNSVNPLTGECVNCNAYCKNSGYLFDTISNVGNNTASYCRYKNSNCDNSVCTADQQQMTSGKSCCSGNYYSGQDGIAYCGIKPPAPLFPPQSPGALGQSCAFDKPCQLGGFCQFDPFNILNLFWTCKGPNVIITNITTSTATAEPPPAGGYIISTKTAIPSHNSICVGGISETEAGGVTFKYCPDSSSCYVKCTSQIDPSITQTFLYNKSASTCGNIFSSSNISLPATCIENSSLFPNICPGYTGYFAVGNGGVHGSGCGTPNICGLGVQGGDYCSYSALDDNGNPIIKKTTDNPALPNVSVNAYCPAISLTDPYSCQAFPGQVESFNNIVCGTGYSGVLSTTYKQIPCSDQNCTGYQNSTGGLFPLEVSQPAFLTVGTQINGQCKYTANQTFFVYSVCGNDGGISTIADNCQYGCTEGYGCEPPEFLNMSCIPNIPLNGTCVNSTAVSQRICDNTGTYSTSKTYNCPHGEACNPALGYCLSGNYTATYIQKASVGNVTISAFTTTAMILILLTVGCSAIYFFLEDEFIPILLFTIANFILATLNYFSYGYLIALFGAELMVISYKGNKTKVD